MNRKGFTLIELLIVVAIIAILAAIAVPNFLEAQTRARVGRIHGDLRSFATAMESYRIDNNAYPLYFNSHDGSGFASNVAWEATFASYLLTTPVSYMSALLHDPYSLKFGSSSPGGSPQGGSGKAETYTYFYRRTWPVGQGGWYAPAGAFLYSGDFLRRDLVGKAYDCYNHEGWFLSNVSYNTSAQWVMGSAGPNQMFPTLQRAQTPEYGTAWNNPLFPDLCYDPTNGTKSEGDILRFGP